MTLPPPPDSFFDGGKPQSQVDPGGTGRELLHEVKNLAQAVMLLQAVIVPREEVDRRRRHATVWSLLGLMLVVSLVGYTRFIGLEQTRQRIAANRVSCEQDNRRGLLEIEVLQSSARMSANDPSSQAFFLPRIAKFQELQKDCLSIYPKPGQPGYPTFWGSAG